MFSRTSVRYPFIFCATITLLLIFAGATCAQTANAAEPAKKLTVERIYSDPGLSGHALRGIAWTPDGKQVSFLEAKRSSAEDGADGDVENGPHAKKKKENNPDLWLVDVTSGD